MPCLLRLFGVAASVALYLVMSVATSAIALEFSFHPNSSSMPKVTAILAVGDVETGDVERFLAFLAGSPRRDNTAIYLASPGGSLYEGMRLGMLFKKLSVKTVVEGGRDCASACALAFLGGRDGNGRPWRSSSSTSRLGFHAFSSADSPLQDESETQLVVSQVLAYGREVDAPLELLILNFATPSSSIYWLSVDEICSLGIKLWDVEGNRFTC